MPDPPARSPQQTVTGLFRALDALDFDAILGLHAADAQGVDELTGGWRRGRDQLHAYFNAARAAGLADVHSAPENVHVSEWGDAAVVTLVLDQTYTVNGASHHLRAPTTIVLRREDGAWRVVLFHSVPLEEEGPPAGRATPREWPAPPG